MRRCLPLSFIVLALLTTGCHRQSSATLTVLAANANVGAIVGAVGGDRVEVTTVAPAGMCPGHFDLRPSHVAAAARAQLIIHQGWETWFPELEKSLPAGRREIVRAATPGNWMLPGAHLAALVELTAVLTRADTAGADSFRLRSARYAAGVDSAAGVARALLDRARGRALPPVIAAEHQAAFLRWLGLRVVVTYGRPEDFTARELSRLAQVGVDSAVGLIVDNLQSGPDAGLELARALGAAHVTLSNFPLEDGYPATLVANAAAVARALE